MLDSALLECGGGIVYLASPLWVTFGCVQFLASGCYGSSSSFMAPKVVRILILRTR